MTKDELLDNVMLYWVTASGVLGTAVLGELRQLRRRGTGDPAHRRGRVPREILRAPRHWCDNNYPNITRWTTMPRGGHFAAFEQPALFVEDVVTFFRAVR